ncbi:DUF6417 family protein [Streptomyces echinatus]|uniref:DUF6417 family protein n=1 Tax=Streptomyces echinatus TaxID=67293 RepID=UPI0037BA7448
MPPRRHKTAPRRARRWSNCAPQRWTRCACTSGSEHCCGSRRPTAWRNRCAQPVSRPGNRWSLRLNAEQTESVAYAFYLRSMGGSVTEANRFGRAYGVAFHADRATGSLRLTRL